MNYYVSTPTGSRCLAKCREYGFREFSCPVKMTNGVLMSRSLTTNLENFALDNGAWIFSVAKIQADFGRFDTALEAMGETADFVVVPDIVAGGLDSLRLSEKWVPRILDRTRLGLVPVQDGITRRRW